MLGWVVAIGLILVGGPQRAQSPVPSVTPAPPDGTVIDASKARAFSDSLVKAILEGKPAEIRRHMEDAFRVAVPDNQMEPLLTRVYSYGGKPLEAEFKSAEVGYRLYEGGRAKPLRKFWYAVRTSEHPKGKYFLFVEVVPDETSLACASFQIVSFPLGAPPILK
jgi:hypothetical protein